MKRRLLLGVRQAATSQAAMTVSLERIEASDGLFLGVRMPPAVRRTVVARGFILLEAGESLDYGRTIPDDGGLVGVKALCPSACSVEFGSWEVGDSSVVFCGPGREAAVVRPLPAEGGLRVASRCFSEVVLFVGPVSSLASMPSIASALASDIQVTIRSSRPVWRALFGMMAVLCLLTACLKLALRRQERRLRQPVGARPLPQATEAASESRVDERRLNESVDLRPESAEDEGAR